MMTDLMNVATAYASGVEGWVAKQKTMTTPARRDDPGTSVVKDQYSHPLRDSRNRKRRNDEYNNDEVNAEFGGQRQRGPGQKKPQWQGKRKGPDFDEIMNRPCDYHSPKDPSLPQANNTSGKCNWHKRAAKWASKK